MYNEEKTVVLYNKVSNTFYKVEVENNVYKKKCKRFQFKFYQQIFLGG